MRDFVHVWDVACAHVEALEQFDRVVGNGFEAINIGTGTGTTIRELVAAFEVAAGASLELNEGPARPGDAVGCYASVDKAATLLGWRAKRSVIQAFRDGLAWARIRADRLAPADGWAAQRISGSRGTSRCSGAARRRTSSWPASRAASAAFAAETPRPRKSPGRASRNSTSIGPRISAMDSVIRRTEIGSLPSRLNVWSLPWSAEAAHVGVGEILDVDVVSKLQTITVDRDGLAGECLADEHGNDECVAHPRTERDAVPQDRERHAVQL